MCLVARRRRPPCTHRHFFGFNYVFWLADLYLQIVFPGFQPSAIMFLKTHQKLKSTNIHLRNGTQLLVCVRYIALESIYVYTYIIINIIIIICVFQSKLDILLCRFLFSSWV